MPASFFKKEKSVLCSKCKNPLEENRRGKQRYCRSCHAEHMRKTRPKHSLLPEEARKKANARAYTKEYVKRGCIIKTPCVLCQKENSEAHHPDYDKPKEVIWLCRTCHLNLHKGIVQVGSEYISKIRSPKGIKKDCSKCGNPVDRLDSRYCKKCRAAYIKEWRKNKTTNG